jgi:hypothetical protein
MPGARRTVRSVLAVAVTRRRACGAYCGGDGIGETAHNYVQVQRPVRSRCDGWMRSARVRDAIPACPPGAGLSGQQLLPLSP